MKKYAKKLKEVVSSVVCNRCGEEVRPDQAWPMDYYFGYFSRKDTQEHKSDICEDCYDFIIKDFKIPPSIEYDVI